MPTPIRSKKARYSLDTVDRLFETAFATATRIPLPKAMKAKMEEARESHKPQTNISDPPPASPTVVSSLHTAPMSPEDGTPDSLWDEVRRMKEKTLAKCPSKVKSVEQALSSSAAEAQAEKKPRLKRRASHMSPTFKESSDGQMMTATFEIPGVQKQDMHVSFRSKHIIVTWRMRNVREKIEDGVLVRDRQEVKHTQFIPLPEGTKFEDVNASQDGQRLILTYPNSRCIPVSPPTSPRTPRTAMSEVTEFHTCSPVEVELEQEP